jgi:integrase
MSGKRRKYEIGHLADRNGTRKSDYLYVFWSEGGRSYRRSTRTTDRAEAEEWLAHFILEKEAPPVRKRHEMPIDLAFEDYLAEHGPALANKKRPEMSHRKMLEYFGTATVDALTPQAVRGYINWRKECGLKNNSIRRELSDLRAALNHQVYEGRLETAPKFRMPPKDPPKDRWLTVTEAAALYTAADAHWLRLFIDIALRTAQRKGAIMELQWEQVKFDEKLIYFNPSGRRQTIKRRAIVPMSAGLYGILRHESKRKSRKTNYVIESNWGPIRGGSMLKSFRAAGKAAGFGRDVTAHTLRHTAASWAAQRRVDHWMIRRLLGHTEANMTERYMHHDKDYLKEIVDVLDSCCASFARNYDDSSVKTEEERQGVTLKIKGL